MQTVEQLNKQFGIEKAARFDVGRGGLTRLMINAAGGQAEIYLLGAHVLQFTPAGQRPVFFVASKAFYEVGKAIRGGIPVVFPWFGPRDGDKTQMHGFVRTRVWDVLEVKKVGDAVVATFGFTSSPETRAIWDHDFACRYIVSVGAKLEVALEVKNTSSAAFKYEDLLHSYYSVGDIRTVAVWGFTGAKYMDKNNVGPHLQTDSAKPLTFVKPEDRVYGGTVGPYAIEDQVFNRRIRIEKKNSNATVVWTPWSDKIGTFADVAAEDWTKFVCVESGNVREDAISLEPGQTHTHRSTISAEVM